MYLEGLRTEPSADSDSMKINSSMSCFPKVQFLLMGRWLSLTRCVAGASFIKINEGKRAIKKKKYFFLPTGKDFFSLNFILNSQKKSKLKGNT